ncbi:unnamed protein product [Kuraishia capsulata CBS 1993]|uniref:Vacuolar protein sorting-associated protein 17 n=1 Tax=Kuraishia capsulata CBS 1993 TaxID=1382522 RepID=W6MXJ3_9ASCO|nr:uncharacterized protein KUCA_T00004976001 [Kuraishia capsulata CBS 1993]CDK28990.1 unnamed protein product [Kuraishia capsulata CBS 1993]
MTSAIPYDPEDFDNNPFSEHSVIQTGDGFVGGPVGSVYYNDNGEEQDADPSPQPEQPVAPSVISEDHSKDPDSFFHKEVSQLDLKKFVPERFHAKSFGMAIKVADIEKNGNTSSAYRNPIVKLNAEVRKLPGFRKTAYKEIRRTYKELDALYRYLMYNNIEVFVPALPAIPTLYNFGSIEFQTTLTNLLQDWFNRITSNAILVRNQEFVLFLEQNDFSYSPSKTKPATNSIMATGLKRKTLKQLHPPYDASQELAEFRPLIKSVYLASQGLVRNLEKIAKLEKNANTSISDFYSKLQELSGLELVSQDMANMWLKLNKVLQLANEMELVKHLNFSSVLIEQFLLVTEDTYNIKEALTNRHLLMRELVQAEESTKRKHANISRLKSKSIIDPLKVDEAIKALDAATNWEKELTFQVKRTTYNMLLESREYTDFLTVSLRKTFKQLAQQQIQAERKKLALLHSTKLIPPSDSLARLGREHTTARLKSPSRVPTERNGNSWTSRPKLVFDNESPQKPVTEEYSEYLSDSKASAPVPDLTSKGEVVAEEMSVDAKSAATLLAGSTF